MMKNTLKSYNSDNRGSAIITGLVVSTVLMVLCLSLLLVAYSLFISTAKSTSDLPNREMLYSAAEALEHELLDFSVIYEDGVCKTDISGHKFWEYIDTNIWKGFDEDTGDQDTTGTNWLYFNKSDNSTDHGNLEKCSKYFNMTSIGSVKIIVQLYWELPESFLEDKSNKDGTMLNAIYRLYNNKGELLVKVDRKYKLSYKTKNSVSGSGNGSGTGGGDSISESTPEPIENTIPKKLYPSDDEEEEGHIVIKFQYDNYSGHLIIINKTGAPIDGWKLYFYSSETVTTSDSRYLTTIDADKGIYYIQNLDHDGRLDNNGSATVYFNSPFHYFPTAKLVENTMAPLSDSSIEWDFVKVENQNPEFRITNKSGKTINGWKLDFDYTGTIYNIENADHETFTHSGNHYSIENADWKYKIVNNDETIVLPVQIANWVGKPTNVVLSTYSLTALDEINEVDVVTTTIKWNRIGEEIVNPGGGN